MKASASPASLVSANAFDFSSSSRARSKVSGWQRNEHTRQGLLPESRSNRLPVRSLYPFGQFDGLLAGRITIDKSPLPDCLDFDRDLLIRIGLQEAHLLHQLFHFRASAVPC